MVTDRRGNGQWASYQNPRLLLWPFILLAACHPPGTAPLTPSFDHARKLLESERLQAASDEAERGFQAAGAGSTLSWNFRLLRAQIQLTQREAVQALSLLGEQEPEGSALIEQRARYHLLRGHAEFLLNQVGPAEQELQQAASLASTLSPGRLMAEIDLRRAAIATATGKEPAAEQELTRVLAYAKASQDRPLLMAATGNMGFLLLHSGDYDGAIHWFEQTLEEARSLDAQVSEARALGNIGNCLFRLGDLAPAQRNFEEAVRRFASIGNRFERQIWLGNLGNIEESKEEYDAAAKDYAEAVRISEQLRSASWTATWLNNLAVVSIERGQWDAAENYNERAVALRQLTGDETARLYSDLNAGRIALGRAQYPQAQRMFRTLLLDNSADLTILLDAHAGLAETYAQQRQDRAADGEFRSAIAVMARQQAALLDEEHKLTWFASVIRVYGEYVDYLMQRNRCSEALAIVASSRGRVLSERLGEQLSPSHALSVSNPAAVKGGALLVYWLGARHSYAWVLSGGTMRHYDLPPEQKLREWLEGYSDFIQQLHDPLTEYSAAGEALYNALVAPAQIHGGVVEIAPDGPLYSLNFGTLPVKSTAGVHCWIEDVELTVLPSLAAGRDIAAGAAAPSAPAQDRSLLLIGDPVATDPDFPELAFAGKEMDTIHDAVPAIRQVVERRERATPDTYLQGHPANYSWIHFAAHASTNPDEPLQSALILSRGTRSEYRLVARNIIGVPIHADLVTISACRSAGAHIYAGEGLVGIAWAFLRSGARNVVGGLWDVNDQSTATLMGALYRELAKCSQPATALRTAQLALLHSNGVYRKPIYWGPFEDFRRAGS